MSLLSTTMQRLVSSMRCIPPLLKKQATVMKSPSISYDARNVFCSLQSQHQISHPFAQGFQRVPHASFHTSSPVQITLEYMHKRGLYKKERKKKQTPLDGRPQMRGVVLKTLIKKPKKPNSANRKCVRLRLTNGKEVTAYVPGEGHNLQEHNIVLVQGGKLQDTPGVKLVCVRGKYDLTHVKKK